MSAEVEGLAKLREPFAAEHVGKLPKLTCKDCGGRNPNCQKHQKSKCSVCQAYISSAHVHLDFVGHATITDRLLNVDPLWSWEPVAFNEMGLPAVNLSVTGKEYVLWGRLTVLGVTRLGCGSVALDAFETEKQLIGDFLRNAAMRFGVALELWSKTELESAESEPAAPRAKAKAAPKPKATQPQPWPEHLQPGPAITEALPAASPPTGDKPSPYAAAIHLRASELKIEPDVLDSILLDITGSTSANAVNRENRQAVLDAMAREAG